MLALDKPSVEILQMPTLTIEKFKRTAINKMTHLNLIVRTNNKAFVMAQDESHPKGVCLVEKRFTFAANCHTFPPGKVTMHSHFNVA